MAAPRITDSVSLGLTTGSPRTSQCVCAGWSDRIYNAALLVAGKYTPQWAKSYALHSSDSFGGPWTASYPEIPRKKVET